MQAARQQAAAPTLSQATPEVQRTRKSVPQQARAGNGYTGNQAALRRLSRTPRVQCKLEIGAVNDPLEAEADQVADQVMRIPDPVTAPVLRRKCSACEEEKLQRQSTSPSNSSYPASGAASAAPDSVHNVIGREGAPLDAGVRTFLEPRFGQDLGYVRLHTDNAAARSAQEVGALAYTVGHHVVFGNGQFAPGSASGMRLLAHELAHVAQNGADTGAPEGHLRRTAHGPSTPTNCHNWTIPLPPWIAGTIAHGQISTTLKIPPHSIPRATKLLMGIPSPPSITPFGFADLWSRGSAAVQMGEIKSTATGGTVAANEAKHYITRHDEWLGRETGGAADDRDAAYLAAVGGLFPGGALDLSAITGSDLPLGNFWGDPAKILHIEADSAGAMVYWCTGAGMTGSPLWLPLLKKALDALAKKMQDAKKKLQEVAAKLGEAAGAIGRAILSALLPLLVVLIILAIVALLIIALICLVAAPETGGLSLLCTAAGVAGTVGAAAALLILIGVPLPDLSGATASVFKAAHPDIAAAAAESGADYDRAGDPDPAASISSAGAATTAVAAFNPGDDLIAAITPVTDKLSDPLSLIVAVTRSSSSMSGDSISKLNDALAALDTMGDSATSMFIRSAIQNSGLDKPGALAAVDPAGIEQALALVSGSGEGQPQTAPQDATASQPTPSQATPAQATT